MPPDSRPLSRGSWRHARMTESFRHAVTLWLLDHAAEQATRIGDTLAGPWYRLSAWCKRSYFDRRGSNQTP